MSTKLYYGLVYKGAGGMPGLMKVLAKFKKQYEEAMVEKLFDLKKHLNKGVIQGMFEMQNIINYATHEDKMIANPFDMSCSVVVFPIMEGKKEMILVYPFGYAQDHLHKNFKRSFDEFGYWNNSDDQLEKMSMAQWKRRDRLWNKATKYGGAFNDSGLVFEMDSSNVLNGIVFDFVRAFKERYPEQFKKDHEKYKKEMDDLKKRTPSWTKTDFKCWDYVCDHREDCIFNTRSKSRNFTPELETQKYDEEEKIEGKYGDAIYKNKKYGIKVVCSSYRMENEIKKQKAIKKEKKNARVQN